MKPVIAFSCAFFLGATILMAEPVAQFAKANQEYAAGDFKAAISDYKRKQETRKPAEANANA